MLHKGGFNVFSMCGFKLVARGGNSTYKNYCAINRSILVQWHGVNQSFASESLLGTFKANWLWYSSRQFCHSISGGVDVAHQGPGPAMIWLFDHTLHTDNAC